MADRDQEQPKKRGRKRGRQAWVALNLELVKGLAMQGLTMEKIARTLRISQSTLYKKKRELMEFSEAIKNGEAEGEAVVTSKLFERAKAGEAWAVCFYLKARCGWRDWADPAGANVTITVAMQNWEKERERQRELTRLLTIDEKRIYVALLERAAARQNRQEAARSAGAIATAQRVPGGETSTGSVF